MDFAIFFSKNADVFKKLFLIFQILIYFFLIFPKNVDFKNIYFFENCKKHNFHKIFFEYFKKKNQDFYKNIFLIFKKTEFF